MSQQPFTELPKPKKKQYAVMVFEVIVINHNFTCYHGEPVLNSEGQPIMVLSCEAFSGETEELTTCACCNLPTCNEHMSEQSIMRGYQNFLLCKKCALLPKDILEEATSFQENLNK